MESVRGWSKKMSQKFFLPRASEQVARRKKRRHLVNEEIRVKIPSTHVEISFNKRILDHGDVLRRVRWILIWGPMIAKNSHVGVVVEIEIRSINSQAGQCTNPYGIHVNSDLLMLDRTHTVVGHRLVRSDLKTCKARNLVKMSKSGLTTTE